MAKKITFFTVGMLFAAFLLAGCGTTAEEPQPVVTKTVTETPSPEPVVEMTDEEMFLLNLQASDNPFVYGMDESAALDVAYSTCDLLDSGITVDEVVESFATSGDFSIDQMGAAGYIMGSAIAALCPQHKWQVD